MDRNDIPTPSLSRSSSTDSEGEDPQDGAIDAIVRAASQMKISTSIRANEETCDVNDSSQSTREFFFDEPGPYVDGGPQPVCEEPQPMCDEPGPLFGEPLLFYEEPQFLCEEPQRMFEEPESMQPEITHSANSPASRRGRRRALLIGIKYLGNDQVRTLQAPHHDVYEVRGLLTDVCGWNRESITILRDTGSTKRQPTIDNIRYEIRRLVEGAQPGDHLFFYFSGHGGQQDDQDGDEADGRDEFIVSSDGERLIDDELHEILVKPVPEGCRLTAILDSCHSGTALDLPYNALRASKNKLTRDPLSAARKQSSGNIVLLSACADEGLAQEMRDGDGNRIRGMLTKAFINTMRKRRKTTYDELLTSVRTQLERKQTLQSPQFSSSRMIDMDDYFDL